MVIFGSEAESRPEWTRMVAVVYGSEGGELGYDLSAWPPQSRPKLARLRSDSLDTLMQEECAHFRVDAIRRRKRGPFLSF